MTIEGAVAELQNLINADDVPFYYNSVIEAVIETIIDECKPKMGNVGVSDSKLTMLKDIFEEQRALTDEEMQAYKDMLHRKENDMVTTDKVTVAEFAPHIGKTTTDYKENEMKIPWEQVITTESKFNHTVQRDSASFISELINRVTSLEDTVEFILERLQIHAAENTNDATSTIIKTVRKPRW